MNRLGDRKKEKGPGREKEGGQEGGKMGRDVKKIVEIELTRRGQIDGTLEESETISSGKKGIHTNGD